MRVKIIAVGTRMPAWVQAGVDEFSKRLSHDLPLQWVEIELAKRTDSNPVNARRAEAKLIAEAIPRGAFVVALEVNGKTMTSESLAAWLQKRQMESEEVVFLIGGPDGLEPELSQKAALRWSLSSLTLPHALVRVVLAEALYRAMSIVKGHPYHRA